jgi:hypothetical protein
MISSKDLVNQDQKSQPKTIYVGERVLKINSITLDDTPSRWTPGAMNLILNVETKPIEGFEGFFIDKDDMSKGRYEGQVGRIKATRYGFSDFKNDKVEKKRDLEMLKFFQELCNALGANQWFEDNDGKHETIESYVAQFSKDKPFEGKYLKMIVSGKEYMSKNGYINVDLHLGTKTKEGVVFEAENANPSNLKPFDKEKELIKLVPKETEEFDLTSTSSSSVDDLPF